MKKKLLLLSGVLFANLSWAASYLAVPNLVYESGVKNYGISNADIKGAIIKSGKFKIMNTPKSFNTDAVVASINAKQDADSAAKASLSESREPASFELNKPIKASNHHSPKYILVGEVVAADVHDNYYKIKGTENTTGTRTLNVSVNYNLLNLEDNSILSSFNVSATATQTAILNIGQSEQLQTNQGDLIKGASQDLATKVMEELSVVNTSSDEAGTLVKNFATYN